MNKQHVNVLPPLPSQNNLSYPPINQNTFTQQRNLFPQPPLPYQYPQFSPWKPEERQLPTNQPPPPPPPSSWWSNPVTQNQNYQQESFQRQQYPYLNNSNDNFSNLDYSNKSGYSPWRQQQQRPFVGSGYENQGQNLSMRQVMLKEAVNMPNFATSNPSRTNTVSIDI